jgi:hypothetical protein
MRTAVAEISASLVSIAAAGPLSASSDIGRERSKFRPFRYEGIVRVAIDDGIISPTAKLGLHPERFMSGSIQYAHVSNSAGKRWLERTNFGMLPCHRILQSPALPRFCPHHDHLAYRGPALSFQIIHFTLGTAHTRADNSKHAKLPKRAGHWEYMLTGSNAELAKYIRTADEKCPPTPEFGGSVSTYGKRRTAESRQPAGVKRILAPLISTRSPYSGLFFSSNCVSVQRSETLGIQPVRKCCISCRTNTKRELTRVRMPTPNDTTFCMESKAKQDFKDETKIGRTCSRIEYVDRWPSWCCVHLGTT